MDLVKPRRALYHRHKHRKLTAGKRIVGNILGTDSDTVIHALADKEHITPNKVTEITLDLSDSMNRICRLAFRRASRVIDRFHVQRLALVRSIRKFASNQC